jgi:hypothetical protein
VLLVADHSTDGATSPVCEYMHAFWKCYMLRSFPDVTAYQPFWQRKGKGMCCFLFTLMILPNIRANFFVTNRVFILLFHVAQQVYHIESLHHAGCPMTTAVLRAVIKETHCLERYNITISFRWVSSLLLIMFYILWVPIRSNYFNVFFAVVSVMSCNVC